MVGMPWWFWVIGWTLLVLLCLAVLAWLAWRTTSRLLVLLGEVGDLGEDMASRWDRGAAAVARGIRQTPVPGVLVPVGRARQEFLHERQTRTQRKIAQRIARRERLGQPQRLGDLRREERKTP